MNMINSMGQFFIIKYSLNNIIELSLFSSVYLYSNMLFLLITGYLFDVFPVRRVLLSAIIISIIGGVILWYSDNLICGIIARFLMGVGASGSFISCRKLADGCFNKKNLGFVISIVVFIAMLGGAFAQAPISLLVSTFGGSITLLINLLLGMAIFILIYFLVKPKDILPLTKNNIFSVTKSVVKNPYNWLSGGYISLLNLPLMILGAIWGNLFLTYTYKISTEKASVIILLMFAGIMVGTPFFGWFSDKCNNRVGFMLIASIAALLLSFILLFANDNIYLLSFLFISIGFVSGAQVLGYPIIAEHNSYETNGMANAIASIIIYGVGGSLQLLFGVILNLLSKSTHVSSITFTASSLHYAMYLFPICMFINILLIFILKYLPFKGFVVWFIPKAGQFE
ncbi:MAG: MFS transporter [Lentisphaerae bacterium]|nr:MFS transporter [Lentisphaerota bacterium]MCP4103075.1 MFS transporter [Lentisphaerota bacterium]